MYLFWGVSNSSFRNGVILYGFLAEYKQKPKLVYAHPPRSQTVERRRKNVLPKNISLSITVTMAALLKLCQTAMS